MITYIIKNNEKIKSNVVLNSSSGSRIIIFSNQEALCSFDRQVKEWRKVYPKLNELLSQKSAGKMHFVPMPDSNRIKISNEVYTCIMLHDDCLSVVQALVESQYGQLQLLGMLDDDNEDASTIQKRIVLEVEKAVENGTVFQQRRIQLSEQGRRYFKSVVPNITKNVQNLFFMPKLENKF